MALAALLLAGCVRDEGQLPRDAGLPVDATIPVVADEGVPDLCVGLACQRVACGDRPPTRLVGTVVGPDGALPIHNALVYIPQGDLDPIPHGASCEPCASRASGSPLVSAYTDASGKFVLWDVPAGDGVPLVVQVGKWRRRVTLAYVQACQDNGVHDEARLPRSRAEGDLPRIAIATGSSDPLECMLLSLGIDASELASPGKGAAVDVYRAAALPGAAVDGDTPSVGDPRRGLLVDPARLGAYDLVLLPCQGQPVEEDGALRTNLAGYLDAGGRVVASHDSYDWLSYRGSPFNRVQRPMTPLTDAQGQWMGWHGQLGSGPAVTSQLVSDNSRGKALRSWLVAARAQSPDGVLAIHDVTFSFDEVDRALAVPFAVANLVGDPHDSLFTFDTPLGAPRNVDAGVPGTCGRAIFADFHVATEEWGQGNLLPASCRVPPGGRVLTDQEKALAFLLFEATTCRQ